MPFIFPPDFGFAHGLAIVLLFGFWFIYSFLLRLIGRGSLNEQLGVVRIRWLMNATSRAAKPFDAVLLGHIVNSIAFFGSATMIVLAGVITALANVRAVHGVVSELYFASDSSFELFVINAAIVNTVLALSFFSFTYALRKLIYVIALVGALPEESAKQTHVDGMVTAAATVLTEELKTFNFGIRGYYYFIAALGLFISPYICLALTLIVTAILFYRQLASPTAAAIRDYVDSTDPQRPQSGGDA